MAKPITEEEFLNTLFSGKNNKTLKQADNAVYVKHCIRQYFEVNIPNDPLYKKGDQKEVSKELDGLVKSVYESLTTEGKEFKATVLHPNSVLNKYACVTKITDNLKNTPTPEALNNIHGEIKGTEIVRVAVKDNIIGNILEEFRNRVKVIGKDGKITELDDKSMHTITSAIAEKMNEGHLFGRFEDWSLKELDDLAKSNVRTEIVNIMVGGAESSNQKSAANVSQRTQGQIIENSLFFIDHARGTNWKEFFVKAAELVCNICSNIKNGEAGKNNKLISDFYNNNKSMYVLKEKFETNAKASAERIAERVQAPANKIEFSNNAITNKWTAKVSQQQSNEGPAR